MKDIETITIGGVVYNAVQANALNQKKLMGLIGARVSINSAASGSVEIEKTMIYGLLLSLPEIEFDQVSSIVLHKTVKQGGDALVTVEDFQGSIHSYFQLIAELVIFNLNDFFTWLDAENAKQRLANSEEESP